VQLGPQKSHNGKVATLWLQTSVRDKRRLPEAGAVPEYSDRFTHAAAWSTTWLKPRLCAAWTTSCTARDVFPTASATSNCTWLHKNEIAHKGTADNRAKLLGLSFIHPLNEQLWGAFHFHGGACLNGGLFRNRRLASCTKGIHIDCVGAAGSSPA